MTMSAAWAEPPRSSPATATMEWIFMRRKLGGINGRKRDTEIPRGIPYEQCLLALPDRRETSVVRSNDCPIELLNSGNLSPQCRQKVRHGDSIFVKPFPPRPIATSGQVQKWSSFVFAARAAFRHRLTIAWKRRMDDLLHIARAARYAEGLVYVPAGGPRRCIPSSILTPPPTIKGPT